MGNREDKEKQLKLSLTYKGMSNLYLACQSGKTDIVRQILEKCSYHDLNQIEPNGSTLLHAAAMNGHQDIVRLLIEHGCQRSVVNADRLTAYELAPNDEVRRLFHRPASSRRERFHNDNVDDCFEIVNELEEESSLPSDKAASIERKESVQKYKTSEEKRHEMGYAASSKAMCRSKLGRLLVDYVHDDAPLELETMARHLKEIVDREVAKNDDSEWEKANDLLNRFINHNDHSIEHLFHLYTLETRFYRVLKNDSIPLAIPIYTKLPKLKERYFQGQSYRGACMTVSDLEAYEWAVQHPGSLLQTTNFSSTSLNRQIAEEFIATSEKNTNKRTVVFIFHFPKKCDQAINLGKISDKLPCLSEYEDEAEVLVLPWTLFEVKSVYKNDENDTCSIYLRNVLIPHKSLLSTFLWTARHSRERDCAFQKYKSKK
ncbi:unnamed protein product [Didymodactylos carnosus]|uniref:Mono(ADP-ribosyl)transferase n=1 Tax=Didymodactylos carnosus TaxID=1234261 RepID=A0A815FEL0_9BILA|nr:unnamed protein product [Didymodactylos carnosus]CAF4172724.1 unnamed protein product [Didymodactylos carnosus]